MKRSFLAASGLCIALLASPVLSADGANSEGSTRPQRWAQPLQVEGVRNLYKVSGDLYRSAQPKAESMQSLDDLGMKTVVSVRFFHSGRRPTDGTDITYERIAMMPWKTQKKKVVEFLQIATDPERAPVLLHCYKGADRTGMLAAMYRIVAQGWTKEADKMSKGEIAKGATRWFLGVGKAERRWAEKVGVDPYTNFEPLQAQLRRLGKYEAGAAKGVSFVGPTIHESLEYVKMTYKLVWSTDLEELRAVNKKRLAELGASAELIEAFFKVEPLSLSLQTFLISALMELPEVEDRVIPIEQALTLQTQTDSLFHIECVAMASWFHTTQAPLERFVRGTMVPAGMTGDGRLVLFSAADFAYWAEETALGSVEFNEIYKPLSEQREVWIAGRATPMFIAGAEDLGWEVRTNLRQEVLPRLPWGVE